MSRQRSLATWSSATALSKFQEVSDKDKADEKLSDLLNAPIRTMGRACAENYRRVQVSDAADHMDFASAITITDTLILKDLDKLKTQDLLNDEPERTLSRPPWGRGGEGQL